MQDIKENQNIAQVNPCFLLGLFFSAFVVWCYSFWGFLTDTLPLNSDATSYYDHTKFFIQNLAKGVYPLWDPYWMYGAPNEFFLRRIGSFNPVYVILAILYKLGLSYKWVYAFFLSGYWFLGAVGFYFIAKKIYNDRLTAFVVFLLLYFSSIGTRQFDSYINLVITPSIWFFYFLVSFLGKPTRINTLGCVFTLMILLTTYIPFYFLIVLISFMICLLIVYIDKARGILTEFSGFVYKNKLFVVLCLFSLICACIPGIEMYKSAKSGEFVMPHRGQMAESSNAMAVSSQNITSWTIPEELFFASAYKDFREFTFAIAYIPIFSLVILVLSPFCRINRRTILYLLWGGFLFLLGSPRLIGVHGVLYNSLPFFKLFKNLHWFLWIAVIPISILFLGEIFVQISQWRTNQKKVNVARAIYVLGAMAILIYWLNTNTYILKSSWVVLIVAVILFVFKSFWGTLRNKSWFFIFLFMLIVIQPVEVYHYLVKNTDKKIGEYTYENINLNFDFVRYKQRDPNQVIDRMELYYAPKEIYLLNENLAPEILYDYVRHRILIYDNIKQVEESNYDYELIGRMFKAKDNIAFVDKVDKDFDFEDGVSLKFNFLEESSKEFQVVSFDSNNLKIKTNFSKRKFLVFNDSYHLLWKAYVNNQLVDLFKANVGFKGVWLSPGENIVNFKYGNRALFLKNYFLLFLYVFIFGYLLLLGLKKTN